MQEVSSSIFDGIEGFGRQFLLSIFIVACTLVAARAVFGWKSKLTREAAVIGILCLIVGLQYYFLLDVVTYIPASRFFTYNSKLVRVDCKTSNKGGKRVDGETNLYDLNPCYCNSLVAKCLNKLTGATVSGECPIDNNHRCNYISNGNPIYPYISSERNCRGGQGDKCTKDEPCFPCDINSITLFETDRCRTCSSDYSGDCKFVPEIGPYCYDKPGSKKVVPCKKCCTQPRPLIFNGTCY